MRLKSGFSAVQTRAGRKQCHQFNLRRWILVKPFWPVGLVENDWHALVHLAHRLIGTAGQDVQVKISSPLVGELPPNAGSVPTHHRRHALAVHGTDGNQHQAGGRLFRSVSKFGTGVEANFDFEIVVGGQATVHDIPIKLSLVYGKRGAGGFGPASIVCVVRITPESPL